MATPTTTGPAIVQRAIDVLEQRLVPTSDNGVRYTRWIAEGRVPFMDAMERDPGAAFRKFHLYDGGRDETPVVSDAQAHEAFVELVLELAYAQDMRAGANGDVDRNRIIDEDRRQIQKALGLHGRENFTAPTYPDACWRGPKGDEAWERIAGEGVDFLVMRFRLSFYLDVS